MSISENDLELLEAYLDDELPIADAEQLWRRFAVEAELAAALEEARGQRAVRMAIWKQMEPTDRQEQAVRRHVATSVRRSNLLQGMGRVFMGTAAAAAMIMIGFGIGRVGGGSSNNAGNNNLAAGNGSGPVMATNDRVAENPPADKLVDVGYFDPNGNLMAVQKFKSMQDANAFVHDVNGPNPSATENPNTTVKNISDNEWR